MRVTLGFPRARAVQPPILVENVCCFECKEVMYGLGYDCSRCEFFIRKKCSMLSPKINHVYHHNHPGLYYSSCICNFRRKTCRGFVYHCSACKFDLDVKCALLIHLMKLLSFTSTPVT
ncbi:DC1 domain-containing family protein [Gossypium australe]|uniref:DC1 domain-containing family protein n=1 Tax=Gossypium australe TaxID=47621 RepID=A0A5B6VT56_9ROSI|nr:DC1 domain-containing family protein [Gossypium australe]